MKPTLIIMAAGMGSRFGGLKQLTPVGPAGEKLLDYSMYDAMQAGFGKVVFVIKHAIEDAFKAEIGSKIEGIIPVEYVYQELDALPAGYTVPAGREKPWGTGHAVLCCRNVVKEPFAVINADDYYGPEGFEKLAKFLAKPQTDGKMHFAMAGYRLSNTLTENGYVSRGICEVNAADMLTGLTERTHIELQNGVPAFTEDDGATWTPLSPETTVSMNCWGFPAGTLDYFEALFKAFLNERGGELKSEFYLPFAVNSLVDEGKADVQVLTTDDKWYGMTYAADHDMVRAAIAKLTEAGQYPTELWRR